MRQTLGKHRVGKHKVKPHSQDCRGRGRSKRPFKMYPNISFITLSIKSKKIIENIKKIKKKCLVSCILSVLSVFCCFRCMRVDDLTMFYLYFTSHMLLQPHFQQGMLQNSKQTSSPNRIQKKPGRFLRNTPNQSPPRTRSAWVQGVQEEKDESTFFLISGRPAGPGAPQASRQLQVDLTTQVRYCGNNRNILRITVRHALSHWLLW